MAYVHNYTFDNLTRLGDESCCIDQNTIQNVVSCNYMTQNFFSSDCSMKKPINLATTQPGIFYKGGYNIGAGGCNIDYNSLLTIGSIQTQPKCHIDLFQRPFSTVPYLGRGTVNPVVESQIMQGEQIINKRSVNNLSEKSYIKYHQTPLIPNMKKLINDPSNKIEDVASEGWVRGGVPSRELNRDSTYYNNDNKW